MVLNDLPNELWQDIQQYIPRSQHRKLIGVNRFFFEQAMDSLYAEVRLIDDDGQTMKSFGQILAFPSIARRVQRIFIRPTWLPGFHERKPLDSHSHVSKLASSALKRCPNVQEIAFVLYDHVITQSFSDFLTSIWESPAFAQTLRQLTISSTTAALPRILSPLTREYRRFPRLEGVTFNISQSRLAKLNAASQSSLWSSTMAFFLVCCSSLTSLCLRADGTSDSLSSVAVPLMDFPSLRKFELIANFSPQMGLKTWSNFFSKHAKTLEELCIKPSIERNLTYSDSDRLYAKWINPPEGFEGPAALVGKMFLNLKSLEVGLREGEVSNGVAYLKPDLYDSKVFPSIPSFAPGLVSLSLTGISLSFRRIADIINDISSCRTLVTFHFTAATLSAEVFDLLAKKLSRLKILSIQFNWLQDVNAVVRRNQQLELFTSLMEPRKYQTWKLERLRLTQIENTCGVPHPQQRAMQAVARSFPAGVNLDHKYECFCQKGLLYGGEEKVA